MKKCPACGSELEDTQMKCPLCGFIIKTHEEIVGKAKVAQPDITKKLEEMKARLRRLSGEPSPEPPMPSISEEEIPSQPEEVKEEPEPEAKEAMPEISEEPISEEELPPPTEAEKIIEEEPPEEAIEEAQIEAEETLEEEPQIKEAEVEVVEPEAPVAEAIPESVEEFRVPRRGAVNGLGFPVPAREGLKLPEKLGYKIRPSEITKKKVGVGKQAAVTAVIIFIVLFASWYLLFSQSATALPKIDGNFDEWLEVTSYYSIVESDDLEMGFWENTVQYHEGSLFWYFMTYYSPFMSASQITSYALFVDADGSANTGFSLAPDFGAELMVTISGYGGAPVSKTVSEFAGSDRGNWSAWRTIIHSLAVAIAYDQAETSFPIPSSVSFSPTSSRFVSVAYNGVSTPSITPFFTLSPGVLVVTQRSVIPSSGEVEIGQGEDILELTLKGYGKLFSVDSIDPFMTNISMSGHLSVHWNSFQEMHIGTTLRVMVDTSSVASGTKIGATVTPESIDTEFPSVIVLGQPAIGYVGELPLGIVIDGCFGDWINLTNDFDVTSTENQDIDISKIGYESSAEDAYFYTEVIGEMFSGSFIPVVKSVVGPSGSTTEPGLISRVSGEDILRIYIDVDPSNDTGALSPIAEEDIRPDYKVEIRGRNGHIFSRMLYIWDEWDENWSMLSSTGIEAAKDEYRIEVGISKEILGNLSQAVAAIEMTDWLDNRDNSSTLESFVDPFVMNDGGKVWGSLDGTSWVAKTDVLPGGSNLVDITSDDLGYLYAIFDNGTVYQSIDAAISWSRIIDGTTTISETTMGITCDRSANLYLLTYRAKVYRAPITGGSWVWMGQVPGAPNNFEDIDWTTGTDPASTVIYVIRSDDSPLSLSLSRSDDGGATWSVVSLPTYDAKVSSVASVRVGGNDRLYLLELDGDVHVSNNSGTTWESTHISSGGANSDCLDLDTDLNNDLWVARERGDIYRLNVTTWTWTTLFSLSDKNAIIAFSTAPIPEFGGFQLFTIIFSIIPIVLVMRRTRKRK